MAHKKSSDKNAELIAAIDSGDKAAVARLLAAGADPNARSSAEEPAIELACFADAGEILQMLLDAGAEVDAVDGLHRTALMAAAARGNVKVMRRLIKAGANVNFQSDNDNGNTVLTSVLDPSAVEDPSERVVQTLLRAGANPSMPSKGGWTPLHYAVYFPHTKVVNLLLKAGADVKATRGTDWYAVDVADSLGHEELVKRLIARGSPTVEETAGRRMQAVWKRIGRWFKKNAPAYSRDLSKAKGASRSAIEELEQTLDVNLPSDFRAYLAMYGGSGRVSFYEYEGLPVEQIVRRWAGLESLRKKGTFKKSAPRELSKDADEIQWTWWDAGWIPFAEDGGGNLYCVDLCPGARGRCGQVIQWEMHAGPFGPIAPSFEGFLDGYMAQMEAGELVYRDDCLTRG